MKEGWKMVKLGEVCEVIAGQSPDSKYYNKTGVGIPFYQGKKEFTDKYIGAPTTWTTMETKIAEENDILMSVRAPVGDVNFAIERICIGRGLAAIRPSKMLNKDYLYYYLVCEKVNIKGKEGAVFPSINRNEIRAIEIPLPSLEEQHRIVGILDAAFAKIDALKKNAEENLKNAKALFQQVLAQELKPKDGWVEKKLGEVVKHITDGDHQPPPKSNQGIPFITISNINKDNRTIDWRNTLYVPKEYFDGLKDDRKPKTGDILYTVTGSYGIPVLIDSDSEFCFQRHIAIIRPNKEIVCSEFLYNWALSEYSKEQAEDTATGAAQKTVSLKSMRNFKISFPTDIEEQRRIVCSLDTLSEKCRRLEQIAQQTIRECDALKQSILRQAFSGEL